MYLCIFKLASRAILVMVTNNLHNRYSRYSTHKLYVYISNSRYYVRHVSLKETVKTACALYVHNIYTYLETCRYNIY